MGGGLAVSLLGHIFFGENGNKKQGSSNILAEQFQAGAEKAGHEVFLFDAAHAQIAPCLACGHCHRTGDGNCCKKDDMEDLKKLIFSSDMAQNGLPALPPEIVVKIFVPYKICNHVVSFAKPARDIACTRMNDI